MSTKTLTREEVLRWSPEHGHGDPLRASVLALLAERDALIAERDAARERVKVLEDALRECREAHIEGSSPCLGPDSCGMLQRIDAALSPTTDGAPKSKCSECGHRAHLEVCTSRSGGTAYACGCMKVTP